MLVLHNVVRGAQDGASPARWQSCLGRFPSPLETTKNGLPAPLARDRGAPHTVARLVTPNP